MRLTGVKFLVVNGPEAWIHQLGALGAELDVVVQLPGRAPRPWNARMRPLPEGARTVSLDDVRYDVGSYDCVVGHDMTDLLDTRAIDAPKLLVLHETLEGYLARLGSRTGPREMQAILNGCLATVAGHAVAVSRSRAKSWGVTHLVLQDSADPEAYLPYIGDVACGLRVVNEATVKRGELAWAFHERAMDGLPLRIVGHAPDLRGVAAANDWHHLKRMLASHRFVVHTTDPRYEDGYDLSVLEAMAAGVPVLTNRNATTIVQHGVTGFVSETPDEMRAHAERLLGDEGLARELGSNARAYVARYHSPDRFRAEFPKAVQEARKRWVRRTGKGARAWE